jgi:hypothetical protein
MTHTELLPFEIPSVDEVPLTFSSLRGQCLGMKFGQIPHIDVGCTWPFGRTAALNHCVVPIKGRCVEFGWRRNFVQGWLSLKGVRWILEKMEKVHTHPVNIGRVENHHVPTDGILVLIVEVPGS